MREIADDFDDIPFLETIGRIRRPERESRSKTLESERFQSLSKWNSSEEGQNESNLKHSVIE
jgi:hypothetical protein